MRILLRQKYLIPTICLFLGLIVPWTSSKAGEKITAKVVVVKGEVLYNGEAVEKDQVLAEDGLIEVKAKHFCGLSGTGKFAKIAVIKTCGKYLKLSICQLFN